MKNYSRHIKFPEDWKLSSIKDILNFYSTATYSRADLNEEDPTMYIHYGDIHTKFNFHLDLNEKNLPRVPDEKVKKYELIKEGDIIIADASEDYEGVGKAVEVINVKDKKVIAGLHTFLLRDNDDNFASQFKGYTFLSSFVREQFYRLATGTKVYSISKVALGSIIIPVPPLDEQKMIANCLATWDKVIKLQTVLLASKESRKKAFAQQLLTGKRRLPGFTDNWNGVSLGDMGDAYTGLSGKNKVHFGSGKPYITYMNIFSNSTVDLSTFPLVEVESDEKQNKVKYGDILFTVSSETPNQAGMVSVLLDDSIEELYLNSFCFGYRLNDFKKLLPIFASFILRSDVFRKEIYKLAQGSTRFNISKSGVLKIVFRIPSVEEQKAIANVLETADVELQLEKEKLTDLQQQKKALMQQLLTGKVRLV